GSPAPWRSRERRHAGQVAAKGAVAVVLWGLAARRGFPAVAVMAAGAATAAAVADTLASEIGRRSRWPPRMLGSGQVVAAGTPGAVSWIGSLAALLGAAALAVATALLGLLPWGGVPATAVAALVAVFAESLLAGDGPAARHDPVAANLMLGLLAALLAAAIGTIQSWIH